MSNASTIKMIRAYLQEALAPMFLSSFFQSPAENFHTTEDVEIDIEREGEELAIVLTDLSQGPRKNESSILTNKRFKPPIYDEEGTLNGFDLIKREPGATPFEDPNYTANAIRRAFRILRKLERKVRRAIELMSSQVLQTGTLTLVDSSGNTLYSLDFQPKATHFPTSGTGWGNTGADPLGDLRSLSNVIRRDGRVSPNILVFGQDAFQYFVDNDDVQARLDNRSIMAGEIAPEMRSPDAVFQGFVWIGNYRFQMWTYDGFYTDPQTGNATEYVDPDNVIMLSSQSRLDLTFGAIPQLVDPDPRLAPFMEAMPGRIPNVPGGMDLTTNAWITPNGRSLNVSAGTRPLTIPTGIDTFGCLTTQP